MTDVKLVFLKIKKGDFAQGFEVTLRICKNDSSSSIEVDGSLPPDPKIPEIYQNWRKNYLRMDYCFRARKGETIPDVGKLSEECRKASKEFRDSIKAWLKNSQNSEFQKIRETLTDNLSRAEEIRVFIQTQDELLKKIPWQEWDLFADKYTKAEIILSPPENLVSPTISTPENTKTLIKILAILGNSEGINVDVDRNFLQNLPDVDPLFLVEPKRPNVSDRLWENNWDILFFAGHSSSDSTSGSISINPDETMPLMELKHGLRRSIESGLKLAIFNSCDGLKLAENLADLHIPLVIVMREPVPDRIAQGFLKYFLTAYSGGESLYLAVRKARERLDTEGLDTEFPGATWLPVIYQYPAVCPPTWQGFIRPPSLRKTWECVQTFQSHSDAVKSVAIHPNGQIIASSSLDKTIKLWNLSTGQLLHTLTAHSSAVISVTFSPDGKTLASASNMEFQDGTIKLWDVETGTLKQTLGAGLLNFRTSCLAFSPDGQTLATGHIGTTPIWAIINLWNLNAGQIKNTLRGHGWEVESIAFSKDGRLLISGGLDGAIKIWNWHKEELLHTLNRPSPSDFMASIASWLDSSVGMIWSVAISPDSQIVASGGSNQPIQLWSAKTGNLLGTFTEHSDRIYSLAFSPDGETRSPFYSPFPFPAKNSRNRNKFTVCPKFKGINEIPSKRDCTQPSPQYHS